jgi:hypothetical protein
MMHLKTEPYADQAARWPREGRHILAHHDAETIVVYQAYRPADAATDHKHRRAAFIGTHRYSPGTHTHDRFWIDSTPRVRRR